MKRDELNRMAVRYMARVMDMHDPGWDQEQNWILRHLVEFAQHAQGQRAKKIRTRAVKSQRKGERT